MVLSGLMALREPSAGSWGVQAIEVIMGTVALLLLLLCMVCFAIALVYGVLWSRKMRE